MSRLPNPGGDDGQWGGILNDFLGQVHDPASGLLKANSVGTNQIQDGAITASKLSATSPTSGQVLSYSGTSLTWSTSSGSGSVPDASTTTKGLIQLTGDLSGSGGVASVAKVQGISISATAPSTGQVLTATSGSAASWSTPSSGGGVTSVAGRTGAITIVEGDVANLTSDLATKAADSAVVHLAGTETITGGKNFTGTLQSGGQAVVVTNDARLSGVPANGSVTYTKLSAAGASTGQVLSYDGSNLAWSTPSSSGSISDATSGAKGIIQLTGDLSGTAGTPQITSTHLSAALPINQGGTGSASQNFVDLSTAQTVAGVKTFSSSPIVPQTPTTATQAASKGYVDTAVASVSGGGGSLAIQDEGTVKTSAATSINFVGAGVTATNSGAAVTVTIPGGGGGGGSFPAWNIVHQTASAGNPTYTATAGDWVLIDASSHGMAVTLPAPVANATVLVKKTDSGSLSVTVSGPGGTLVDPPAGAYTLNGSAAAGQYLSDGTNWYAISNY